MMLQSTIGLRMMAQAEESRFAEGVELAIVGMGLVFVSLIIIWAMLVLINLPSKRAARQQVMKSKLPPPTPYGSSGEIDPIRLAIIAAAVATVVRRPHRIQRVQFVRQTAQNWAATGRQEIQASHRLRKGRK